ncbi:MAG: hypothetical protein ACK56F_21170, partial [bacterium]
KGYCRKSEKPCVNHFPLQNIIYNIILNINSSFKNQITNNYKITPFVGQMENKQIAAWWSLSF